MKKIMDIMMMVLLLLLMSFPFTGVNIHIFLGIMMIVCFIIHHYLNKNWYHNLFKGKKTKIKWLFIFINTLLIFNVILVALSGLTFAGYVPFIPYFLARKIHLVCSYWSYLLMGLHVGLHLQVMKYIKNKLIAYMLVILSVILLIKNQLFVYLFNLSDFLYISDQMNIFLYITEYFLMFMVFVFLMNEVVKEMKKG